MKAFHVLRNIASALTGRLATAGLNYGLFWYLARTLEPSVLGGFSLLMSVSMMITLLPMLGLSIPFMRRIAVSAETLPVDLSNAFAFALPVSVALCLLVGLWGQHSHHQELAIAYWLVGATLIPGAWAMVAECTLLGRERMKDVTRINLLEAVLRTGLSIFVVHLGYGLNQIFAVCLAARSVSAMIYVFHPMIVIPRVNLWSAELQRRNWREVPVYLGIAVVAALVARLDVVMLSYLRDLREAATYAAASRLYEAAQIVPSVTALVVMPLLARQHVSNPESIPATLNMIVRVGLTFALGLSVFASAFAQPLINLLYRPEMSAAAGVLGCLMFAAALMVIDVILSSTMIATNAQAHDLRALTVGLIALAVALLALVPKFGSLGAAVAVTVGLIVRLFMRLRWAARDLHASVPWLAILLLVPACAAGVMAAMTMSRHGSLVAGLSGLLAYVCVAVLSGALGSGFVGDLRAGMALLALRK